MTAQEAVAFLASKRRAVLLGGMAMILHGLSRSTKDYDIWLDPVGGPETWAREIKELLGLEPALGAQRINPGGNWLAIRKEEIAGVGAEDGLVRLSGMDRPIDVFSARGSRKNIRLAWSIAPKTKQQNFLRALPLRS